MDKWIRQLNENDFKELLPQVDNLERVPEYLDKKVLQIINRGEDIITKEEKTKKPPPYIPLLAAAVFAFALLIPVTLFFLLKQPSGEITLEKTVQTSVYLISNSVSRRIGDSAKDLHMKDRIREGQTIITGGRSECRIMIDGNIHLTLFENSSISFSSLKHDNKNLTIADGALFIDSRDPALEINTPYVTTFTLGTRYFVEHSGDRGTFIAVVEGIILIKLKTTAHKDETLQCEAGDSMRVSKDGLVEQKEIGTPLLQVLDEQMKSESTLPEVPAEKATLTILDEGPAAVFLNDEKMATFSRSISMTLKPGTYRLRIEKEGCLPYNDRLELTAGSDREIKELIFETVKKDMAWTGSLLYQYKNRENSEERSIIGFASSSDRAVAITEGAVIGFKNEEKQWIRSYGKSKGIYFMSMPFMNDNNVYISSYNDYKFLVIDAETGREIKVIDAPGYMSYGYSMVKYRHAIYLPFGSGIYTLIPETDTIRSTPLYTISSPTTPVFGGDRMYVSSFTDEIIMSFSVDGTGEWSFSTEKKSYCPVVLIEETIYFGDNYGHVYILDKDMKKTRTIELPAGIASMTGGDSDSLYILTMDGVLSVMDRKNLSIKPFLTIDRHPDSNGYHYKKPLYADGKLFIGTDSGQIIIINAAAGVIEKRLALSGSAFTSTACPFMDAFLAGTASGEIYLIAYKEKVNND